MTDAKEAQQLQEFTRIISHDVGGALRGVSQLTAMLERDISDRLSEKERYWMGLIKLSAERSQGMVEAVTQYNRLAEALQSPQLLDLRPLIEAQLVHLAQKSGTELTLHSSLAQVQLEGAAEHWRILVQSLLSNAVRFCQRDSGEVRVSLQVDGPYVYFAVEDNGTGLAENRREHYLQLFKTSAEQTDLMHLGAGLSYCARIAELNGAVLQLTDSELGGLKVIYRFSTQGCL
ncbi:MAG: ATP-binding protein [Pseudomonadales bacterium]